MIHGREIKPDKNTDAMLWCKVLGLNRIAHAEAYVSFMRDYIKLKSGIYRFVALDGDAELRIGAMASSVEKPHVIALTGWEVSDPYEVPTGWTAHWTGSSRLLVVASELYPERR